MLQNMNDTDRMKFMSNTLSCIGDGVIVTDSLETVLYINAQAEKMTGWKTCEATGKPFGDIFLLVDFFSGRKLDSPVRKTLSTGETVGLRNHSALITSEGKILFVSASCSPVKGDSGETEGAVVVFRDIDRIKNMEEDIIKEKDNLRNVLEALPLSISLVTGDSTVKWVNRPFLNMFRCDEEHVLGQRFGDVTHCVYSYEKGCGKGSKCRTCEIRKSIGTVIREKVNRKNVTLQRAYLNDGSSDNLWLKINFIPTEVSDEKQIIIAIEDITEQKNFEAALKKGREEAESANRIKSEFLANMSHEIRTPLNGVIGMLELLAISDPSHEQEEYIQMAKLSANSLLKVINDILDFSRIEAGKVSIENIRFDIKAMADEIIKIHTILAEKKGLKLQYSFSPGIPQYLTGDPNRLRQILNNLVGNAVKFTENGGINVDVKETGLGGETVELEFLISDTGIGISGEKMDLLFKRFSQVDGSNTRRYSGTGLGLAICKQLAEMMGGNISAVSESGKGSTFRFTAAFSPGKTPSTDDPQEEGQPLSPVIMDDKDLDSFISQESLNGRDRVVIMENRSGSEKYGRVRLGEDGEIIFGGNDENAAGEESASGLEELGQIMEELRGMLREKEYSGIEDAAHRIKKAAIRINADELADMAFKIQLAARKCNWDRVMEYCLKMTDEFNVHRQGGIGYENINSRG